MRCSGKPVTFKLGTGAVIKGLDQGAYARGSPDARIPPGATLVYEVELLAIEGESE